MDFSLSEQQLLVQSTVSRLLGESCPPDRVRRLYDGQATLDRALWGELADIGIPGLLVPESEGGSGLGMLEMALVCEQLGRAAAPVAAEMHALACHAVALGGTAEQRVRWLPALATGEAVGTVAFAGVDAAAPAAMPPIVHAHGRLTGLLRNVPLADVAAVIVVVCSDGSGLLLDGGALAGAVRPVAGIDRSRAIFDLALEDVAVEPLAGPVGFVTDAAMVLLAADAFGAAGRLIELAVNYAQERRQFGRPIGQFQAVKHQLADMDIATRSGRGLFWQAAYRQQQPGPEARRAALLANAHITDQAVQAARRAIEVFGGIGYTWECDAQFFLKRALFDRQYLGTPAEKREQYALLAGWLA